MDLPLDEFLEQLDVRKEIAAQVASVFTGISKAASVVTAASPVATAASPVATAASPVATAASPVPDPGIAHRNQTLSINTASPVSMVGVNSSAIERFASAVVTMLGIPPAGDQNILSIIHSRVSTAVLHTPGFSANAETALAIGDMVVRTVSNRMIASIDGVELLERHFKGFASSPMPPLTRHADPSN